MSQASQDRQPPAPGSAGSSPSQGRGGGALTPFPGAGRRGRRGPARLLIAHDEPIVRAALAYLFHQAGWRVQTAANGQEAADVARIGRFDLLLLDERLALLGGLEALALLRRDPAGRDVPAMLLSRSPVTMIAARCAELGATAMPIGQAADVGLLLRRVAEMLRAGAGEGPGLAAAA
ncbi:MAG: response regulator [Planctomycetota bacterium]|nr:response regulator [Planctomycetota bacterium]